MSKELWSGIFMLLLGIAVTIYFAYLTRLAKFNKRKFIEILKISTFLPAEKLAGRFGNIYFQVVSALGFCLGLLFFGVGLLILFLLTVW